MKKSLSKLYQGIFNTVECNNGNHYFIEYNNSNLICKKCGRFAKIGYLQNEVKKMKTLSTYRVNPPTTTSGHSISVTTTIFGTEEEVEYIRQSCAETIGSGLVQEYNNLLTSRFREISQGKVVPDIRDGWRYEE